MLYDAVILGGGPAGMIAMLRLANEGLKVLGVELMPRPRDFQNDTRSTAFLNPSIETLKTAGVLDALTPYSTSLRVMEIVDASQSPVESVAFKSEEIGLPAFAINIENHHLKRELQKAVENNKNISIIYGNGLKNFSQFDDFIELRLNNENLIKTRILVGAEGRQSPLRKMLDIDIVRKDYPQSALAFTVTHDKDHQETSTEIHLMGGPFTTVPCCDIDAKPASGIVWMDDAVQIERLTKLPKGQLEELVNERSQGLRGRMQIVSEITSFPMMNMEADRLVKHRGILIGEAAHVVPPIGAQGLNMSLRDIESLTRALLTGALQSPDQLLSWEASRKRDISIRRNGIDLLNQVSIGQFNRAHSLRKLGLWALGKKTPLRRGLIKLGLGGP